MREVCFRSCVANFLSHTACVKHSIGQSARPALELCCFHKGHTAIVTECASSGASSSVKNIASVEGKCACLPIAFSKEDCAEAVRMHPIVAHPRAQNATWPPTRLSPQGSLQGSGCTLPQQSRRQTQGLGPCRRSRQHKAHGPPWAPTTPPTNPRQPRLYSLNTFFAPALRYHPNLPHQPRPYCLHRSPWPPATPTKSASPALTVTTLLLASRHPYPANLARSAPPRPVPSGKANWSQVCHYLHLRCSRSEALQ